MKAREEQQCTNCITYIIVELLGDSTYLVLTVFAKQPLASPGQLIILSVHIENILMH